MQCMKSCWSLWIIKSNHISTVHLIFPLHPIMYHAEFGLLDCGCSPGWIECTQREGLYGRFIVLKCWLQLSKVILCRIDNVDIILCKSYFNAWNILIQPTSNIYEYKIEQQPPTTIVLFLVLFSKKVSRNDIRPRKYVAGIDKENKVIAKN